MSALTAGERMARWQAALTKTMACANQVQSIDDPIARMECSGYTIVPSMCKGVLGVSRGRRHPAQEVSLRTYSEEATTNKFRSL